MIWFSFTDAFCFLLDLFPVYFPVSFHYYDGRDCYYIILYYQVPPRRSRLFAFLRAFLRALISSRSVTLLSALLLSLSSSSSRSCSALSQKFVSLIKTRFVDPHLRARSVVLDRLASVIPELCGVGFWLLTLKLKLMLTSKLKVESWKLPSRPSWKKRDSLRPFLSKRIKPGRELWRQNDIAGEACLSIVRGPWGLDLVVVDVDDDYEDEGDDDDKV